MGFLAAIRLHDLKSFTFARIAAKLHCSAEAVRKVHHRAIEKLRRLLGCLR